jgi:hypothetical protein
MRVRLGPRSSVGGRVPRLKLLLAAAVGALVLVAPAFASYCFYQGYLGPNGAVFLGHHPAPPVYVRGKLGALFAQDLSRVHQQGLLLGRISEISAQL